MDIRPLVLINPRMAMTGSIAQKVFPPLGMMYLAAALKAAGEPVRLIDANAAAIGDSDIVRRLEDINPIAVGIPVFDLTLPGAAKLVRAIRQRFPSITLFAGGPAATVAPENTCRLLPDIDHVLRGEAEESIVEYAAALHGRRRLEGIQGFWRRGDDIEGATAAPARVRDLGTVELPDRDCLVENYRRRLYYTILVPDRRIDCVVTSRGCPHRCAFCYNWRYRQAYRSVESCLEEFLMLRDSGVTTVEILDDNFTTDRDRAMEIFDRLARERIPMRFRIKARADAIDDALMRAARRAGVYQVSIGAESGSPEMLCAMKKRITPQTVADAVKSVMSTGAYCHTSFIVGFPGETRETMAQTMKLIKAASPTSVSVDVLAPYQGTAVYEQARAAGTLVGDWTTDETAELPWVRLEWTRTRKDLEDARKSMLQKTYFSGRYIARYAGMIIGGMNPRMGRYLVQEALTTLPEIGMPARPAGRNKTDD